MKCHYEVLNVSKEADEDEIKSAYKKLALKWHPDKNLDSIEHATEQFQLVQQAYEVLSDRQERAWYDKHREQILRGSDSSFKENNLDVYQFFTTTCFKGYSDDDNGFYTVYRNVFEQIAKEDMEFMESKEDFCNIPMFGISTSDYDETVAPFYDVWMFYSTKKSYVWLDPYNIKEIKNRRILKLAQKENDKIRQKAKKERNEEVRSLVAFVRKRDKRVQAQMKLMEAKKLENRQKQVRISKQKKLERLKQLDESGEQAEWMKFENVRSELEEVEKNLVQEFGDKISASEQSSSDQEELDHLYCVACNKIFKTPKAFKNHESSKKHRENVDGLKKNMVYEEDELDRASKNILESDSEVNEILAGTEENIEIETNSNSENDISPSVITEKSKTKKKNRKAKNVIDMANLENMSDNESIDHLLLTHPDSDDDDSVKETTKKQKRKKKKENKSSATTNGNSEVNHEEIKLKSKGCKKESSRSKKSNQPILEVDVENTCVVCKSNFTSKNKLFDHLKKTGHTVYINPTVKLEKKKKTFVKKE